MLIQFKLSEIQGVTYFSNFKCCVFRFGAPAVNLQLFTSDKCFLGYKIQELRHHQSALGNIYKPLCLK